MSNVRAWLSGGHVHFLQLATRLRGRGPNAYPLREYAHCVLNKGRAIYLNVFSEAHNLNVYNV